MLPELVSTETSLLFTEMLVTQATRITNEFRQRWEVCIRDSAGSQRISSLHASRDNYYSVLTGHLKFLEGCVEFARLQQDIFLDGNDFASKLVDAENETRNLIDELFPRWQSIDDLKQMIIEKLSPSPDRLRELAKRFPPLQSWHQETENPFEGRDAMDATEAKRIAVQTLADFMWQVARFTGRLQEFRQLVSDTSKFVREGYGEPSEEEVVDPISLVGWFAAQIDEMERNQRTDEGESGTSAKSA
jgi:hypothetical protein